MSDAAQPTLEYFSETVRPGVPAGTTIAEISLRPPRSPVTAVTVMRSVIAVPELVMKLFAPLITHSPPSSRAVVRVAPASEPPAGLGEPECAERLSRGEPGKPTRLLRRRPEPGDRHGAQRDGRLQGDRHRGVDAGEFLQRDAEREVVAAHAAVFLGEGQPEKAHCAHPPDEVVGELAAFVEIADDRCDGGPGEIRDGLA